jgi:fumarate reductase subunit D
MVHSGLVKIYIVYTFFINGLFALAFYTGAHKMFHILFHLKLVNFFPMATLVVYSLQCPTMGTVCSSCMIFMCNFLVDT